MFCRRMAVSLPGVPRKRPALTWRSPRAVGLRPVLSVIRALLAANDSNRVILFYGNASTGRAMCLEELLGLKDRYLQRLSLHFVMSREPQDIELYNGRLDAGRVRQLAQALFAPSEVSEYFVCGPGNMIDEVSATLRELGVEGDRIHGEHFTVATTTAVAGTAESVAASALGRLRSSSRMRHRELFRWSLARSRRLALQLSLLRPPPPS